MRKLSISLLLAALAALPAAPVVARPIALLVGVGDYQDPAIRDLEGPPHDVVAMKRLLGDRFGFAAADIRTLVDAEATHDRILAELDQLQTRSKPGDLVFLYFSGHGTSAQDRDANLPLPHTSGAFIPADVRMDSDTRQLMNSLIIGQRDIRPRLSALERGGRHIRAVSDSCYSGQQVRSLNSLPSRHVSLPARGGRDEIEMSLDLGNRPEAPPYPYGNVLYMAAASDSEKAADIPAHLLPRAPTLDGKPHGAFTDALLRAMSGALPTDVNRDGSVSNGELFEAVARFMDERGYGHHPQLLPASREDVNRLAQGRVLAAAAPAAVPPAASPAVAVRLRAEQAAETWQASLGEIPGLRLVDQGETLRVRAAAGDHWELLSPSGDRISLGDRKQIVQRLKAEVWLRQVLARSDAGRRFNVSLEADPATRGGTFVEGETLAFVLRSEKPGHLLLLNLDAAGQITVLYPDRPSELKVLAAQQTLIVPGPQAHDRIKVTPPFGTDQLIAFVFAEEPALLARLRARSNFGVDDPELSRLMPLLEGNTPYGATPYTLRSLSRADLARQTKNSK